jgi:hypothetical protein
LIFQFIDEQRADGHGVESICQVLREQSLAVAPRTYRSWKTNPAPARAVSDAAILDTLRHLRTGSVIGGPLPEVLYGRRKMTAWLTRPAHRPATPPTRRRHEIRDGSAAAGAGGPTIPQLQHALCQLNATEPRDSVAYTPREIRVNS